MEEESINPVQIKQFLYELIENNEDTPPEMLQVIENVLSMEDKDLAFLLFTYQDFLNKEVNQNG
jgi:hypothetical protein